MHDSTVLKTLGMINAEVLNPRTNECYKLDFYVVPNHLVLILGSEACQQMKFLTFNMENVLAVDREKALTLNQINSQYSDLFICRIWYP